MIIGAGAIKGTPYGAKIIKKVLLSKEFRRAKAIVLLPGKRYKRKQKKYYYWGENHKKVLLPGERYKAKAINVLLPGKRYKRK